MFEHKDDNKKPVSPILLFAASIGISIAAFLAVPGIIMFAARDISNAHMNTQTLQESCCITDVCMYNTTKRIITHFDYNGDKSHDSSDEEQICWVHCPYLKRRRWRDFVYRGIKPRSIITFAWIERIDIHTLNAGMKSKALSLIFESQRDYSEGDYNGQCFADGSSSQYTLNETDPHQYDIEQLESPDRILIRRRG
jgi:hypothetical protein